MNQNQYDFSQPNKLDRKALMLVLGTSVWTTVRAAWPILLLFIVKREMYNGYLIASIAVAVLFTFGFKIISYLCFSYEVSGDELIIRKGWLNKSKTVVKFDKIHEVNLNQKFIHKIVGLYLVNIDTAGSASTEIVINGIDYHKALAFKSVLTERAGSSQIIQEVEADEEVPLVKKNGDEVITIGFPSLVKIGLTRNYLQTFGLLIAFSFQIIDQVQDFFYKGQDHSVYDDISNISYRQYMGIIGIAMMLGLMIFVVLFNLVRTLLTYYNYKITIKERQLTVSYGLTDSHIVSVPSAKVQMFQFQQNYFQKIMNLYEVKIKQVESEEENKKKKGIVVPGADSSELKKIFRVVFDADLDTSGRFYKPGKGVLLLKFLWLCIPAFLAFIVMYVTDSLAFSWLVPLIFAFLYVLVYIGYRNERLVFKGDFVILRKGIWDLGTTVLHIDKIQKLSLEQSYFQEKKQIGSLNLHTAAGVVTIYYYDFKMLRKMADEILYKIEKNKRSWM